MKTLLSILCGLFLAGCTAVTMKEPFPETLLTEEERSGLEGVWQLEEMAINIAFTSKGVPWMAVVEWEEDEFQLQKYRLHFTKHNDALYFCMPTEPGITNEYFFVELKQDAKQVLVWLPNEDVFEALVEKGLLAESADGDVLQLESSAKEILELISTNSAVFNYKEPMLLRKLD